MRRVLKAVARFAGAVLVTTGLLLLIDVAVTLAWQEPISAITSALDQDSLEKELGGAEQASTADRAQLEGKGLGPRQLAGALAARAARRLQEGRAAGRIVMPTLDSNSVMVEGIGTDTLRKGPGHYPSTSLPGQGETVAVAGHRTTYGSPFRPLDKLRKGEPVIMEMPYGRFTYEVERTLIVKPSALWVIGPAKRERLVLTACHPLYSATKRIVIFARLIRSDTASS